MNIVEATKSYEHWLGGQVKLVKRDLNAKHKIMHDSAFGFLRATYYRWLQILPKHCPQAEAAPKLLGVGDLHLENFGTWRDGEARLVWGINDFDEAHTMPYTADLIRLAASALIAIEEKSLFVGAKRACSAILGGYAATIAADEARPFVLEENNDVLRDIAMSDRRDPKKFWKELRQGAAAEPPDDARMLLLKRLPRGGPEVTFYRRTAGAGSLGLPRFVAIRELDRSLVAREAKARAPSARSWAGQGSGEDFVAAMLSKAIRPHDPFLHAEPGWIIRRLAPHCERIALAEIARAAERRTVLEAMGSETANIHRSTRGATARIRKHLKAQKDGWLFDAASAMAQAVHKDWKVWRKRG